jgi:hypothetical protein
LKLLVSESHSHPAGAAGKYVSVQPPLAQGHAEMCARILVGVKNAVVPDKKEVVTIDTALGHVIIPKFSIRDCGFEGIIPTMPMRLLHAVLRTAFGQVICGELRDS